MLVVNTPITNITFSHRAWRNGMTKIILTSILCLVLTACASGSKKIHLSYVSPSQYSAYDCDQLRGEVHRINVRTSVLAGMLDDAEQNARLITTGISVLLYTLGFDVWPVAVVGVPFLGGYEQQEAEYANLKGRQDAIQQTAITKKCKGS
jgi:hypothetical protein